MSNDADPIKLTKVGIVTVNPTKEGMVQIVVEGFGGNGNCTCRDVAILACMWAIGELQREVMRSIEEPGGGAIGIG